MSPATGPVPGVVLGDVLGRGGFAIVYRARQVAVERDVAVKTDVRTVDDERSKRRSCARRRRRAASPTTPT